MTKMNKYVAPLLVNTGAMIHEAADAGKLEVLLGEMDEKIKERALNISTIISFAAAELVAAVVPAFGYPDDSEASRERGAQIYAHVLNYVGKLLVDAYHR